jgi:uncharacterized membrane protein
MKYILFLITLISSITILGNSSIQKIGKTITVEALDQTTVNVLESFTLITNAQGGGTYFLDETNVFLIDYHFLTNKEYDEVLFVLNSDTLIFSALQPFLLKGIKKGEHDVSIALLKDGKQTNQAKIGLHLITKAPLIKNDAVVLGLLVLILGAIFYSESLLGFKGFYKYVPALLLCYFVPAIFNTLNIISGEYSKLYFVASRYLLPASLVLLCLSIDLKGIAKLGWRALVMFFTGTVGIIIGGPIALLIIASVAPGVLGADASEVWRGLATVAGSWIGGGANQAAMKEIFETPNDIFSKMIVVDVIVANVWMAVLLYGTGISDKIDKKLNADASAIKSLKEKMETLAKKMAKIPSTTDLMVIAAIGLGGTGLAHFGADIIAPLLKEKEAFLSSIGLSSLASGFFWLIVLATAIGVVFSFTKLRKFEGAGASKVGSLFLYVLVATIGTHMDIFAVAESPGLFLVGFIWMSIHAILMLVVAKVIKAPFFFVAVGSQANVGGAASAPVVASAFSPSLAPVGVLLAVMGYAVGTGGAWLCAVLMQAIEIGG